MAFRAGYELGLYRQRGAPIKFFAYADEWAIHRLAEQTCRALNAGSPGLSEIIHGPAHVFDRVVHFGARYLWRRYCRRFSPRNRFVVTSLHGALSDGEEMAGSIHGLVDALPLVSRVVTTCSILEARHLEWGVPPDKLAVVPLGVDLGHFVPPRGDERRNARERFHVPDGSLCVGSFQKDGVGWADGLEPKLVKGPDVLVETLRRLRQEFPVFVLLTGPARGYVKQRLSNAAIPFHHVQFANFREIVACYHALDLYLITSRDEGGPLALLESMATGVPVASTAVGMAADAIEHAVNGMLVGREDSGALATAAGELLADVDKRLRMAAMALDTVKDYDWSRVAQRQLDTVYAPLLADLGLLGNLHDKPVAYEPGR